MQLMPSKQRMQLTWEKYGLIVVGNIVFFMLLYFISYRPHNDENRASEFLSLAQQAEVEDNYGTAKILYQKVVADYPETRSAQTAKIRIESIVKRKKKPSPPAPSVPQQPVFDIDKMLSEKPAVYVAKFLANQYDTDPKLQSKLKQTIGDYLKIAINYDGVLLQTIKTEKAFQRKEFQDAFFALRPRCQMKSDWIYDDFFIKNTGIFPWHNVRIKMVVGQGDKKTSADVRIPSLAPGGVYEIVSFHVNKSGGDVSCSGTLRSREGQASFRNRI